MAEFKTIDEYIERFPAEQQAILRQVRQTIHAAAPEAEERISYHMPAFRQGETLLWFAAMKDHLGIYPTRSGIEAFADRLTEYKLAKGTIRIPWGAPVPYGLIAEITRFRLKETKTKKQ